MHQKLYSKYSRQPVTALLSLSVPIKTHNGSVCEDCGANYTKLKDYYDNSFGHDPTRVCIDISDHVRNTNNMPRSFSNHD